MNGGHSAWNRAWLAAFALAAIASHAAFAIELPQENSVPGGVKLIRLVSAGDVPPYVDADGHRALVVRDGPPGSR